MDMLVDLSWRVYPAAAPAAVGAVLVLRGLRLLGNGLGLSIWDPDKSLTLVRGFRWGVTGLAVMALAAAWQWHLLWLLLLALAIGGEELLESSLVVAALRQGKELARRPVTARG